MIRYDDVIIAINRVLGWREGIELGFLEKQLSQSLQLYWNRKEFDGTIKSALWCLYRAGYETEYVTKEILIDQRREKFPNDPDLEFNAVAGYRSTPSGLFKPAGLYVST
jgi:hypothetical protein